MENAEDVVNLEFESESIVTDVSHAKIGTITDNEQLVTSTWRICLHWKKRLTIFPSPAGMSLTKLSMSGNS
jgi:hypothetical protein